MRYFRVVNRVFDFMVKGRTINEAKREAIATLTRYAKTPANRKTAHTWGPVTVTEVVKNPTRRVKAMKLNPQQKSDPRMRLLPQMDREIIERMGITIESYARFLNTTVDNLIGVKTNPQKIDREFFNGGVSRNWTEVESFARHPDAIQYAKTVARTAKISRKDIVVFRSSMFHRSTVYIHNSAVKPMKNPAPSYANSGQLWETMEGDKLRRVLRSLGVKNAADMSYRYWDRVPKSVQVKFLAWFRSVESSK